MSQSPLLDRPDEAALFLRPGGGIGRAAFLSDVHGLAAMIEGAGPVLNLCRDRYWFVVAFAAALVRGRASLLAGSPMAAALIGQYPDCVAIDDARAETAGRGAADNPALPDEQLAAIVFTSGSTGAPVAHEKRWGELVARSRAAGRRFGFAETAPASIIGTVPPGHMYGFETTALLPLHAACASWCGETFFPADVEAAVAQVPAPAVIVTTPLQLRSLREIAAPGLQCAISATAPLDPALAGEIEAQWRAPVFEIFGATECGSIASRRTVEGDSWLPYPGVAVREIDGVAYAGDVALADELAIAADGRFRLLGRRADMVKLGGRRASLAGLNQILTGLDGVRDGIFVVPDDIERRSTARLMALVVAPERSGPSILAELRARMDPIFVPRRVVHVDALPRNALGKLPRQAVLDLLAQSR